jgi:glycosyltransferase involved in cell wall biosynthesis
MSTPLVSVVIPTFNRPQFLPRAVESALTCQGEDVEVIVVPNGPDTSWQQSLVHWKFDSRVRISPIETAHGNVARNHGMALARGKYLRFLDDDDFLLPSAREQVDILEASNADICSGLLTNVDQENENIGLVSFPNTDDFVCAAATSSGFTLPVGNLFRRQSINDVTWDVHVDRLQDNVWMIDLAMRREWSWVHCTKSVGAWFQHDSGRVSSSTLFTGRNSYIVARLLKLNETLTRTSRSTGKRSFTIASTLWLYIHRGFPYHPFHWSRIARHALAICDTARPDDPFYQTGPFRTLNPVICEWLLFPIRRVTRAARDAKQRHNDNYRRRL